MRLGKGITIFAATAVLWGQGPPPLPPGQRPPNQGSLKNVPLPQFTNASKYIKDQSALVILGKAFFWDMQTGSDGRLACATCHFHGGADHPMPNQLNNSLAPFPANQILRGDQFPFQLLVNVNHNRCALLSGRPDASRAPVI